MQIAVSIGDRLLDGRRPSSPSHAIKRDSNGDLELATEAALDRRYIVASNHRSTCGWKGQAHYYSLLVDGDLNPDAVWFYPEPFEAAATVKGRVAFWKGVDVS